MENFESLDEHALFKAIAEHSPAVIGAKSLDGRYIYVNREYSRLFGRPVADFIGKTDHEVFPEEIAEQFRAADLRVQELGAPIRVEEVAMVDGELRHYLSSKFPIRNADGELVATGVVATDITDKMLAEKERDESLRELERAFSQIKTLKGLIPICASCKKIRDDSGFWNHMESYVQAHSDATFSHGMCPDCEAEWYQKLEE